MDRILLLNSVMSHGSVTVTFSVEKIPLPYTEILES